MEKNYKTRFIKLCLCLVLFTAVLPAWSRCTRTGISQTEDDRTALIPFGNINLGSAYFAPPGTMLASVVVPPTNYTYGGASGESVLWECDVYDLPDIYFLAATNGDDRVGGYFNLGQYDGLSNVYGTWFAYVGLRQTMSGVTLTRYWKKIPLSSYRQSGSKIQIRLQDIPPLQAELYRISTLPGTNAASSYCGNNNNDGSGIGYASSSGRNYSCNQPNAYIQLAGNASVSFSFAHDMPNEDSARYYKFWGADNGFGYGMRIANKLYSRPTCVVRNVTPYVRLPTLSAVDLNAGIEGKANFNVRIECDNYVQSGIRGTQIALGIQVSEGAYKAAESLGLVNTLGGVKALVSDNYFNSSMAKGVGIYIANSKQPGTPMTLVGQSGQASTFPAGNGAGWYPVLDNADFAGASGAGLSWYNHSFIATLRKLEGRKVTAGNIRATAYVLVRMQ